MLPAYPAIYERDSETVDSHSQKEMTQSQERQGKDMAQPNSKHMRTLSKLMEAGFDNEKDIQGMTMDDILGLPNITVAEIGIINSIQKAVKAGKIITFLGGGEI